MDQQRIVAEDNVLFSTFIINKTDKIISVCEHSLADGNFLLAYFMKWILNNSSNKLCLVNLHHTLTHYQSIGKRLGFDVISGIKTGDVKTIEPMKAIVNNLTGAENDVNFFGKSVAKDLFLKIKCDAQTIKKNTNDNVYVIIDDISHLLDTGVSLKDLLTFINCCSNLPVTLMILTHVSDKTDGILGNLLCHMSDVYFDVLPLKTGFSRDVTGILKFKRQKNNYNCEQSYENTYHFKAMEKQVKIFLPGEAMHLFYK